MFHHEFILRPTESAVLLITVISDRILGLRLKCACGFSLVCVPAPAESRAIDVAHSHAAKCEARVSGSPLRTLTGEEAAARGLSSAGIWLTDDVW